MPVLSASQVERLVETGYTLRPGHLFRGGARLALSRFGALSGIALASVATALLAAFFPLWGALVSVLAQVLLEAALYFVLARALPGGQDMRFNATLVLGVLVTILFTSLLTLAGIVAFVVPGVYLFAMLIFALPFFATGVTSSPRAAIGLAHRFSSRRVGSTLLLALPMLSLNLLDIAWEMGKEQMGALSGSWGIALEALGLTMVTCPLEIWMTATLVFALHDFARQAEISPT